MTQITPSFIYWITRLDGIKAFFGTVCVFSAISLIVFIISSIVTGAYNDNEHRIHLKGLKISLCIFLSTALSTIFTPDTKHACAMYVIPKIINNEQIQEVGREFYDLALDWMKEMHPRKSLENKKTSK